MVMRNPKIFTVTEIKPISKSEMRRLEVLKDAEIVKLRTALKYIAQDQDAYDGFLAIKYRDVAKKALGKK